MTSAVAMTSAADTATAAAAARHANDYLYLTCM